MPRSMSTALAAVFSSGQFNPVVFVQLTFVSGPQNIWSGTGSITWNSITWAGLGSLASISTIEEGSTVAAKGINVSCSAIDPTLLSDLLSEVQVGLPAKVYLGSFQADGVTLIADPVAAWIGRIDDPEVEVGAVTATISINCEDRLVEMNTPVDRRYTHDDQQLDAPGDLAFEGVPGIQMSFISWGSIPFQQFHS